MSHCARETLARKFRQNWLNKFSDIRYNNFFDKVLDDSLTNLNWLPNISLNKITAEALPLSPTTDTGDSGFFEITCSLDQLDENSRLFYKTYTSGKPPFSYLSLICMAIQDIGQSRVTFTQICEWIIINFPYYQLVDVIWQNSVRNLLAVSKCFQKVPRRKDEPEKGGFWRLSSDYQKYLSQSANTSTSSTNASNNNNNNSNTCINNHNNNNNNFKNNSYINTGSNKSSRIHNNNSVNNPNASSNHNIQNQELYNNYLCVNPSNRYSNVNTNCNHSITNSSQHNHSQLTSMLGPMDINNPQINNSHHFMNNLHSTSHNHKNHHYHSSHHHYKNHSHHNYSSVGSTHQHNNFNSSLGYSKKISYNTSNNNRSFNNILHNYHFNISNQNMINSNNSFLFNYAPHYLTNSSYQTDGNNHYLNHFKRQNNRSAISFQNSNELQYSQQKLNGTNNLNGLNNFSQYPQIAGDSYSELNMTPSKSVVNNTNINHTNVGSNSSSNTDRFCSPQHPFYMNPAAMSTPITSANTNMSNIINLNSTNNSLITTQQSLTNTSTTSLTNHNQYTQFNYLPNSIKQKSSSSSSLTDIDRIYSTKHTNKNLSSGRQSSISNNLLTASNNNTNSWNSTRASFSNYLTNNNNNLKLNGIKGCSLQRSSSNSSFSSFRHLVNKRISYQYSPILNGYNNTKNCSNYKYYDTSINSHSMMKLNNESFSPFNDNLTSSKNNMSYYPHKSKNSRARSELINQTNEYNSSDQFLVNSDMVKEEFSLSSSPNFCSSLIPGSGTTQIKEEMKESCSNDWWNLNQNDTGIMDTLSSCEKTEPFVSSPYMGLDKEQQWVDEELNLEELDSILGLS